MESDVEVVVEVDHGVLKTIESVDVKFEERYAFDLFLKLLLLLSSLNQVLLRILDFLVVVLNMLGQCIYFLHVLFCFIQVNVLVDIRRKANLASHGIILVRRRPTAE